MASEGYVNIFKKVLAVTVGGINSILSFTMLLKMFDSVLVINLSDLELIGLTIIFSLILFAILWWIMYKLFRIDEKTIYSYAIPSAYFAEVIILIFVLLIDGIAFFYFICDLTTVLTGSFALFFLIRFLFKKVKEKRNG